MARVAPRARGVRGRAGAGRGPGPGHNFTVASRGVRTCLRVLARARAGVQAPGVVAGRLPGPGWSNVSEVPPPGGGLAVPVWEWIDLCGLLCTCGVRGRGACAQSAVRCGWVVAPMLELCAIFFSFYNATSTHTQRTREKWQPGAARRALRTQRESRRARGMPPSHAAPTWAQRQHTSSSESGTCNVVWAARAQLSCIPSSCCSCPRSSVL